MNSTSSFPTAEEWLSLPMEVDDSRVVVGSSSQPIIRPLTKNLIEAPEKAFKTTFAMRLMLGMSTGTTVFPQLPVLRPRRVLYVHGELSPPEIQERTRDAAQRLPRPLNNFYQGRDLGIHLGRSPGQQVLEKIVSAVKPDDLVLDPWQALIPGLDENEFQHVSLATHFLDVLIERCQVTLYLVTHLGKDHTRGTRGHSSLAGWRDTLIRVERTTKKHLVRVTVEPRWAAPVEPFNLKFEAGTVWPSDDGEFPPQAESIRTFLRSQSGEADKAAVGKNLNLEGDALRKALKRAEEARAIVIAGEKVRLPEAHSQVVNEIETLPGLGQS